MRQRITWLLLGLIGGLARPMWGEPKPVTSRQIMSWSLTMTGWHRSVAVEAEREARGIFRRAGLDILWRNCSVPSEIPTRHAKKSPGLMIYSNHRGPQQAASRRRIWGSFSRR